ncbi:hypothetical protein D5S18_15910 [Nocardia panacis]|uniref:Uncharacterized protein n=1 Tax=Nocardia panacis TaxID=2340916 RepID=A0A3A4KP66_9NOCA|nr:hypothetical protein [Nocardia panacis]RJO74900.1 hypothetical protein D5S18_15910 [Nocardia panacis]
MDDLEAATRRAAEAEQKLEELMLSEAFGIRAECLTGTVEARAEAIAAAVKAVRRPRALEPDPSQGMTREADIRPSDPLVEILTRAANSTRY